ncbi:hypothetical protein Cpir12675_005355 [Ceratocystis pirilliformis]|uniref:Uncharacterized protein n=1 Tax=Ceratocystis pirilliformis TaxID=259994 RepID=A0ABR3YQX5_9PEZI
MKASLIILTGASTVSAMWFPNFCCGGFPSADEPQTTTTAATTAATSIPAPTSTELGLDRIYLASSIDREPTTLSTSIIPTKSSDAGSIPIDEDLTFEVNPTANAEITAYTTEVSESINPESVHFSDGEEADDLLGFDSGSDSNSNPVVDPDRELKWIAEETNSKLDATNNRLDSLIQGFKENSARMQALIDKAQKLHAAEGVSGNSEVEDEVHNEEGISFPILPQTTDPNAATPRLGNGYSASSQNFGEDFDDADGSKNTEYQSN